MAWLVALLMLIGACTPEGVELDVTTSVLEVETTTTEAPPATTTTVAPSTTTTVPGLEPVVPSAATVIPIRVVRLADNDGSRQANITTENVIDWVISANEVFAPARFGFSYDPASGLVDLSDTVLNRWSDREDTRWLDRVLRANQLASTYPGELLVLIPRGPVEGQPVMSFASRHTDFVVMGEWDEEYVCGDPGLFSLAHEIGLHLALPTTYVSTFPNEEAAAAELADAGQDPDVFDGDGFDDTPPDPGLYDEHQCSGADTIEVGGLDFELPRDNVMSLYEERDTITLEQVERVRWMLELRQGRDLSSPVNTQTDVAVDAEDALIATQGQCGLPSNQPMDPWIGFQWVDSDQLLVPSEEGCMLDFELEVEDPGTYEIIFLGTRSPEYGAVEISVESEPFHFEDLYAPVLIASGPVVVGETTVTGSALTVSLEVVGANSRSSGTSVGVDGFALRPVEG